METPDILVNAATRFPERTCVIEGDRHLSFADAHRRSDRLAAGLLALGLRRGDRVALLAGNVLEYLEIQVATMRAGLILVPLNWRLAGPELDFITRDATPRVLIYGRAHSQHTAIQVERRFRLEADGTDEPYDSLLGAAEPPAARLPLDAATPATILYTSGTTGRPKGAIIANGALHARLNYFAIEAGMRPGDVFVQPLPMFHMAANVSYAFAYVGATNVMVPAFDPESVLALIERHRATDVLLVPTMINMLCNEPAIAETDLSSLELVLYGASPIPPEVLRRAVAALGCDFLQFFGMTETSGCSLLRPSDHDPDRFPERLASAGTDALSFQTRVVDQHDVEVPPGTVGEILCRGPSLMDGYWNAPQATADALRNGWMHTGDMGYRASDGYLYVTDRLKDMIVSGGENVYPREVEDVLYEHPAVLEAAVIGVPDDRWGERVHALVVARDGTPRALDDLLDYCRPRLAGYKTPKSVELVDSLPKTPTGKVLKKELRERYWQGQERQIG